VPISGVCGRIAHRGTSEVNIPIHDFISVAVGLRQWRVCRAARNVALVLRLRAHLGIAKYLALSLRIRKALRGCRPVYAAA
jgi:hypothetical protein